LKYEALICCVTGAELETFTDQLMTLICFWSAHDTGKFHASGAWVWSHLVNRHTKIGVGTNPCCFIV